MTDRYPRVYAALKNVCISPAKALEILLEAKRNPRGDDWAMKWVRLAKRTWRLEKK